MKKIATILGITGLLIAGSAFGQEQVPDQNPNYEVSMNKYMSMEDSLGSNQGETIQDTYVAYDWTEAKAAKKKERKDRRYDMRDKRMQYNRRCCNQNNGNNGYYNQNGYYSQPYYGTPGAYYYWF